MDAPVALKYPNLYQMLFNAPLMLHEPVATQFAQQFVSLLIDGIRVPTLASEQATQRTQREAYAGNVKRGARFADKPYILTESGIAILPVMGVLAQRAGQIAPDCTEMASYQRITARFEAMMADPEVKGILIEADSPGGQVAGNFELAGKILAAKGVKPVWAHANEMAFSGGYSLAAVAERLHAPMTGMVGSVGVYMMHVDQSQKDAKAGYVYTVIKAGANKDVLNPHQPLAEKDRQWAQASVDRARDLFAQLVATGRSIDLKTVMNTEAGLIEAPDAKQIGFIDDIATFDQTLAAFEARIKAGTLFTPAGGATAQLPATTPEETTMSGTQPAAAQPSAPQPAAAAPAAPAAPDPAIAAPIDQKARIESILGLEDAKDRTALANHIAFKTDMSVDDAKAMLAAAPKQGANANPLATAMNGVPNPSVGVDPNGGGVDQPKPTISATDIYARRAKEVAAYRH